MRKTMVLTVCCVLSMAVGDLLADADAALFEVAN